MISDLFIARPRLASVISIVLIIGGLLAIFVLPISQYPNVAPPTVSVSASYPGSSAQAVADAVAAPLEEAINGVENMIYMSSTSTDAGTYNLSITFAIGTDPDIAQVNVSNRVQLATSQLPTDVARQGVTVRSRSPNFLLALAFYTTNPDALSPIELGAYVSTNVTTALSRVEGVGNASPLGPADYAMRIWTDPDRMAALNISPDEVVAAIQASNTVASIGQIGGAPAPEGQATVYTVTSKGRFSDVSEFQNVVVRASPDGAIVRLSDIARVELGAQSYSVNSYYDGQYPSQLVQVNQSPGANALQTVTAVQAELDRLSQSFPPGLEYAVIYDSTEYVNATIEEIIFSLFLVAAIVVIVVYVFLQDWRATLVPAMAIPVSLIGTFIFLLAFGFSINVITLLALILAIGLVVDDAILVVENCQRVMVERSLDAPEASRQAMREVTGPIISTTLVLLAVFLPTTFLPGLSGQLYRQFGVTLSISLLLSSLVALTLTPALAAIFLKPPRQSWLPLRLFSKGLEKTSSGYSRVVSFLVRRVLVALVILAAGAVIAAFSFTSLPQSLIPDEDQGAILFDVSLPNAASLQRTDEVMEQIAKIIDTTDGVEAYTTAAGFSLLQSAQRPSAGVGIIGLKVWGERRDLFTILGELTGRFSQIPGATVAAFPPPPIPGLGSVGGFSFQILAQQSQDPQEMAQVARAFVAAANERPEISGARTTFSADAPRLFLEIDRDRAETLGLTTSSIYDAIGSTLGQVFVNQFNYQGRVYQVRLQAEAAQRATEDDILNIYAQNRQGQMVPIRTVVTVRTEFGPYAIPRFNLYLAAELSGNPAQGYSSGAALSALQEVASETLPDGYSYQFSGTSYQEQQAGNVTYIAFALAFVFAYLFLVGQYESWLLPLAVMFSLMIAAAGAAGTLYLFGYTSNIYSQIGIVMLIGLASKNAILIVEFARDRHDEGASITEAAITGSRQRLRAVLMTAIAFILGIVPLALATGAGAAARNAIGMTSIGGMLAATLIGIFIVPALYALVQRVAEGKKGKLWGQEDDGDGPGRERAKTGMGFPWARAGKDQKATAEDGETDGARSEDGPNPEPAR
ncbi:MAG: efflux RND transporter permease subunit [Fulvimarina manganoxydans]|uniref:efflux RND transporter permease subunit n=1 Tax=Fulvimarina manganoxydans TaxID=937218 RepID=UPI00235544EA|nr:efflux RND transporter permease subunit [Fulvimarina manganoxydans]MCK5931787.1 efflux RND transporter permease subunit [Fulvimarina manganoxydans]